MADETTSPASTKAESCGPAPYEPPTLVFLGTLLDLTAAASEPGPDPT